LADDDFAAAIKIAQDEFGRHHPDVLESSLRGEAVAMNINSVEEMWNGEKANVGIIRVVFTGR
jgi:hypothetical protein